MKTNHLFFALLTSCAFLSCGSNTEYANNEKVTSLFLSQMEQIDETHKSLTEDSSKIFHSTDMVDSVMLNNKAKNTISNSQGAIDDLKLLQPSEEAAGYMEGVMKYFTAINQYGFNIRKMLDAKTTEEKKALFLELHNRYQALDKMPDSLLKVQKVYFEKVGFTAK